MQACPAVGVYFAAFDHWKIYITVLYYDIVRCIHFTMEKITVFVSNIRMVVQMEL